MNTRMVRKSKTARKPAPARFHFPDPGQGAEGGSTGTGDAGGDGGAGDGGNAGGDGSKTLTQERVNQIVATEKSAAKAQAAKDLAESLGVSVDEAKQIIQDHKTKVESSKDEATKDREAAAREKAEAEKTRTEAQTELFEARADRALTAAGVDGDDEKALARVRRMLDVKPGATLDEIKAEVKEVKDKFPGLFSTTAGGTPPAPGSDPKTGHKPPKAAGDPMKRGMERAQARYQRPEPAKQ